MKYPYRRSYQGSVLKIDIRADSKFFILVLDGYLSFSAHPVKKGPSLKITLCISVNKQVLLSEGFRPESFHDACLINVDKREIMIWVPKKFHGRHRVDHNDLLIRPLSCLLNSLGYYAIHASMARRNEKYIIFSGPGGRGKSTLACALSLSGCKLLCDDMVFIKGSKGEIELVPLKTRIKIDHKERKDFIDVKNLHLEEMPVSPRTKKLFFIFPNYRNNIKPKLISLSKKEGILRLVNDNLVRETGHPDKKAGQISVLDFICELGEKTPFFELVYNDRNLIEAGQMVERAIN